MSTVVRPFTEEEDEAIQQAYAKYGNRWTQIAELLPVPYCFVLDRAALENDASDWNNVVTYRVAQKMQLNSGGRC